MQEAIKKVLKAFDIKKDEMIVIGDGGNDVPMFECGGYKIAMGNADEIIKEKADYITDTNNNDGVAKAIKRIIFNSLKPKTEEDIRYRTQIYQKLERNITLMSQYFSQIKKDGKDCM